MFIKQLETIAFHLIFKKMNMVFPPQQEGS